MFMNHSSADVFTEKNNFKTMSYSYNVLLLTGKDIGE